MNVRADPWARPHAVRAAAGLAVLIVAAAALPAAADAPPPRAMLTVTVIEARKGPPFLHDALKPMWEMLRKSFGEKFGYYDLLSASDRTVDVDGRVEIALPDGDRFAATYGGITPEKGLLRVSLEYGDFRTKVRIHDGGSFFQAGKRFREGTLVIGVKAALEKAR